MSDLIYSTCAVIAGIIFSFVIAAISRKHKSPNAKRKIWLVVWGDYYEPMIESPVAVIFEDTSKGEF